MPVRHPIASTGLPRQPPSSPGQRFLMCPPTYFDVAYAINPWMHPGVPVDLERAAAQWQALVSTLVGLGHTVEQMHPQPQLPDLVFAANGGIAIGGQALAPKFRFAQRSAESGYFAAALGELGYDPVGRPEHLNEGEGDFLLVGDLILAGHGFRSDLAATAEVERYFGIPVAELTLVDERFYHLDTALAVLDETTVAYYPGAFDERSNRLLAARFPTAVLAEEADAAVLGLNMISDGTDVVITASTGRLRGDLLARGYRVHPIEFEEFGKAGGGPKCCVLRLQDRPARLSELSAATATTTATTVTAPAATEINAAV